MDIELSGVPTEKIDKHLKSAISLAMRCGMKSDDALQAGDDIVMKELGVSPLKMFNIDLKAIREENIYKIINESKTKGIKNKVMFTDSLWADWSESQIKEALISLENKVLIQKGNLNDIDYHYFATCNIPSKK